MELQHQIYLLIAIFGGVCALLLVLIIILAIFVRSLRKSVNNEQPERKYENYGFEHDTTGHSNITNDDLRSMKSEAVRRTPHKSNLSKPRNDDSNRQQPNGRPVKDKRAPSAPGRDNNHRKQRQYSESGDTSGRYSDSAFDNEINNMFEDLDDDDDSVVSDRNYNRQQQGRSHHAGPPPPSSGQNNRNRNMGGNHNNNHPGMNRGGPPGGNGHPRSMYPSGNPHEAKTYFNERGMNY